MTLSLSAIHILGATLLRWHGEETILPGAQVGALGWLELGPGAAIHLGQVVALGLLQREGQAIRTQGDGLHSLGALGVTIALTPVSNLVICSTLATFVLRKWNFRQLSHNGHMEWVAPRLNTTATSHNIVWVEKSSLQTLRGREGEWKGVGLRLGRLLLRNH